MMSASVCLSVCLSVCKVYVNFNKAVNLYITIAFLGHNVYVCVCVCVCVVTTGYPDHIDCLADVQENEHGEVLDCLGIYPQVLPIAYEWVITGQAQGQRFCLRNDLLRQES